MPTSIASLNHDLREGGRDHGFVDIEAFVPTGREATGLRIRCLK
jgi:hypothetical protein